MNTASIRRLVQMVTQSRIAELQIDSEPKVRVIVRNAAPAAMIPRIVPSAAVVANTPSQAFPPLAPWRIVASPLVGICRHGASEKSPPLVRCGDTIEAGQVLCVIEAMRLKHNIRSPHSGRLMEVLTEEGDAVDFGRPLFSVESW